MTKSPGKAVRGSTTGRPIMVLLDLLGQRWTLRILWELNKVPLSFRALQEACGGPSPTVLNARLKALKAFNLAEHSPQGYRLTDEGRSLGEILLRLDAWSGDWASGLSPD